MGSTDLVLRCREDAKKRTSKRRLSCIIYSLVHKSTDFLVSMETVLFQREKKQSVVVWPFIRSSRIADLLGVSSRFAFAVSLVMHALFLEATIIRRARLDQKESAKQPQPAGGRPRNKRFGFEFGPGKPDLPIPFLSNIATHAKRDYARWSSVCSPECLKVGFCNPSIEQHYLFANRTDKNSIELIVIFLKCQIKYPQIYTYLSTRTRIRKNNIARN